ncbi:hypothetical protein C8R43DRAFT_959788 [Mycena crocata]|nr:hypothetical protein C8R43DRAFT_959788 [Mycena crocata]
MTKSRLSRTFALLVLPLATSSKDFLRAADVTATHTLTVAETLCAGPCSVLDSVLTGACPGVSSDSFADFIPCGCTNDLSTAWEGCSRCLVMNAENRTEFTITGTNDQEGFEGCGQIRLYSYKTESPWSFMSVPECSPSEAVMRRDIMLFDHPKFVNCSDREKIWSYIVKLSLSDGHNNPKSHALDRVNVALICKSSLNRVYSDASLWSSLYLNHRVEPERIRFVLSHCGDSDLRVRIAFLDIRCHQDVAGTERSVDFLVDRLFAVISGTCGRWKSFYLQTEHPGAFIRVRDHCFGLSVPSMTSLALNYGYLPGYSEYPDDSPIYSDALELFPWFNGTFGPLDHLELVSVYVPWHGSSLLANITSLDISSIYDIEWDFFHEVFTHAVNLKFLRMDALSHCEIPFGYTPRLPALLVLDVGLDDNLFMYNLLFRLDTPLLTDLTVRDIDSGIPHLLICARILNQITRLAIFGLLSYTQMECLEQALGRLFSLIPNLQVLDLRHAEEDVFPAFLFHGANDGMDGHQMQLRHMCVNPPTTAYDSRLCDC